MDAALVALRLELGLDLGRAVGAVGPHLGSGVGLVQHIIELLAVVHARIRLRVPADELVHAVDANVVLVAVEALVALLGPARILVFLGILGRLVLPALRRLAGLDRLILAPAVALHGRGHDRSIDNLAAARDDDCDQPAAGRSLARGNRQSDYRRRDPRSARAQRAPADTQGRE